MYFRLQNPSDSEAGEPAESRSLVRSDHHCFPQEHQPTQGPQLWTRSLHWNLVSVSVIVKVFWKSWILSILLYSHINVYVDNVTRLGQWSWTASTLMWYHPSHTTKWPLSAPDLIPSACSMSTRGSHSGVCDHRRSVLVVPSSGSGIFQTEKMVQVGSRRLIKDNFFKKILNCRKLDSDLNSPAIIILAGQKHKKRNKNVRTKTHTTNRCSFHCFSWMERKSRRWVCVVLELTFACTTVRIHEW